MKLEIESSWTRNEATPRSHVHVRRGLIFVLMWEDYTVKPVLSTHLSGIVYWRDLLQVARLTQVWLAEEFFKEMEMEKKRNIYSTTNWPKSVSTSHCAKNRKIMPLNARRTRSVYVALVFCILLKWPLRWRQQNITRQELGKGNCVVQHQLIQISFTVINEGL